MILNLWMLPAAVLAVVYGAGYCWREGAGWPRSMVKTGAMLLLACAAAGGAPLWVTVGLGFGALGDFCLSRPGTRSFLAGMAAFALGHLAYTAYFAGLAAGMPALAPAAVLVCFAASTELWLAPHTGALRWPVRGYVVVITAMGLAALAQPVPLVLIGAALFVLSDMLLALVLFVVPAAPWRWLLSVTLWAAYWLGQFLILQGVLRPDLAA